MSKKGESRDRHGSTSEKHLYTVYTVAPNKNATYTFEVTFFHLLVPEIKFGEVYNHLTNIYEKEVG